MSSLTLPTRAFLLTISTRDDLSIEAQSSVLKWIQKGTEMHHVVIETGSTGKRHLHAVLLYKANRDARKIQENLWARHVHPCHSDSVGRIAVKVQVCPGNDWYTTYLTKERDVEVLSTNYDPEQAEHYFPDAETQKALVAKRDVPGLPASSSKGWWDKHVLAWIESPFTDESTGALSYLKQCFLDGSINRIKRQRDAVDMAHSLWQHRHKIVTCTEREVFMLKQLDDGPSYDAPSDPKRVTGGAPCI